MRWMTWLNVLAGVGLIAAPFALGYQSLSSVATTEAVVVGLAIGALALWTALSITAPAYVDYFLVLLGGWSVVAPFVLGYQTIEAARNVDIVAGIAVAAIALFRSVYASPTLRHKATA